MDKDFETCLKKGKLIMFPQGKNLVRKELDEAQNDIFDAKTGYEMNRYKWSTIQAYYAMFHAAKALVYSEGYREKSHRCLVTGLSELFVKTKRLDVKAVRDFLNAMNLREAADYESTFSEAGAGAVIVSAEKFIEKAVAILDIEK
jgi:uncharacterized protein (UPF0332 family)